MKATKELRAAMRTVAVDGVHSIRGEPLENILDDLDEAERDRDEAYVKGWNDAVLKINDSAARVANLNDQETKAVIRDRDAWKAKAEAAKQDYARLADAVCASSASVSDACEQARDTRLQRDEAARALEVVAGTFPAHGDEETWIENARSLARSALARIRGSR